MSGVSDKVALFRLLNGLAPGASLSAGDKVKIIIGGAPITQEFADQIGVDGFAADANQAVRVARSLLGLNNLTG